MNMITDPWPHVILDDYIDAPIFDAVLKISQEKIKEGKTGAWRFADERPDLYPDWEKKIKKDYWKLYSNFPEKRLVLSPKILSFVVIIPPGFKNEIHCDRFYKTLKIGRAHV